MLFTAFMVITCTNCLLVLFFREICLFEFVCTCVCAFVGSFPARYFHLLVSYCCYMLHGSAMLID